MAAEVFEAGVDIPSGEGEDEDTKDEALGDDAVEAPAGAEEEEEAPPAAGEDEDSAG